MATARQPAEALTAPGAAGNLFRSDGLLCSLLSGAALLITYPIAEIGYVDDWSYAKSALDFANTGHIHYNGWATAFLGALIPWGALFIRLFGFSFAVVRLSMLPLAMASVYILHQIMARFGIGRRLAVFGSLALGLSPLFVPLATSFMTDLPGLLVTLLCILMCQRALDAESDGRLLIWLGSAFFLNLVLGTVRETAWLGALVIAPCAAWLLRRRRAVIPLSVAAWAASVACILVCLRWFGRQPYVASEVAFATRPTPLSVAPHFLLLFLKILLCLALVTLPVSIGWLAKISELTRKTRAITAVVLAMLFLASVWIGLKGGIHPPREDELLPWMYHVISAQGIVPSRSGDILGSRAVTMGLWTRLLLTLLVASSALAFAAWISDVSRVRRIFSRGAARKDWERMLWLLGPFSVVYCLLLAPRGLQLTIFDRYLLPLMAVGIVFLLRIYEQEGQGRAPAAGWVVLTLFALYTVASTHDQFSLDRARVAAANEMIFAGVKRTAIQGGFEYDGWTQVGDGGHANLPIITNPRGAYDPNVPLLPLPPDCQLPYASFWSRVRPKYFLTLSPMACLAASRFSAVSYRTWLPPFGRKVYVQRMPANKGGPAEGALLANH